MKSRRKLLLAGTVVASLAVMLLLPAVRWRLVGYWRGEPIADGRPLSWWRATIEASHIFTMAVKGPGGETRREVVYDVLGSAATPDVSPGGADGVQLLLRLLDDQDPKVRYFAAQTLGQLGETAVSALLALRAVVGDGAEVMDGVTVGSAAAAAVRRIEDRGTSVRW